MSNLQKDDDLDGESGIVLEYHDAPGDLVEAPAITAHSAYDNEGDLMVEWILPDGSQFCIGIGATPDAIGWWYVTQEDSQTGPLPAEMLRHIRWSPDEQSA